MPLARQGHSVIMKLCDWCGAVFDGPSVFDAPEYAEVEYGRHLCVVTCERHRAKLDSSERS